MFWKKKRVLPKELEEFECLSSKNINKFADRLFGTYDDEDMLSPYVQKMTLAYVCACVNYVQSNPSAFYAEKMGALVELVYDKFAKTQEKYTRNGYKLQRRYWNKKDDWLNLDEAIFEQENSELLSKCKSYEAKKAEMEEGAFYKLLLGNNDMEMFAFYENKMKEKSLGRVMELIDAYSHWINSPNMPIEYTDKFLKREIFVVKNGDILDLYDRIKHVNNGLADFLEGDEKEFENYVKHYLDENEMLYIVENGDLQEYVEQMRADFMEQVEEGRVLLNDLLPITSRAMMAGNGKVIVSKDEILDVLMPSIQKNGPDVMVLLMDVMTRNGVKINIDNNRVDEVLWTCWDGNVNEMFVSQTFTHQKGRNYDAPLKYEDISQKCLAKHNCLGLKKGHADYDMFETEFHADSSMLIVDKRDYDLYLQTKDVKTSDEGR